MADSIDLEKDSDQETIKQKDNKRNFLLTLMNGIFASAGFRFIDSSMVLAAFVKQLTNSNVMVGLISSTMSAGWMWPQLIMSNILEHRQKKMPFYTFGISIRLVSWALITLLTFLIGGNRHFALFICFYILYFASNSSLGISGLPFNDIVAKSIPSNRIARLFGLRQFMGEFLGIGVGISIRFILGEKSSLTFPNNYALIFTLSFIAISVFICNIGFFVASWDSFCQKA